MSQNHCSNAAAPRCSLRTYCCSSTTSRSSLRASRSYGDSNNASGPTYPEPRARLTPSASTARTSGTCCQSPEYATWMSANSCTDDAPCSQRGHPSTPHPDTSILQTTKHHLPDTVQHAIPRLRARQRRTRRTVRERWRQSSLPARRHNRSNRTLGEIGHG